MKIKILLCLFCFLTCLFPTHQIIVCANNTTYFAKILNEETYFYSSPTDNSEYKLFKLPATYFVEILNNANDQEDLFFFAKYIDLNGYVKKTDVQVIIGIPKTPYASNISFRVFSPSGVDLKSTPQDSTPFNRIINVPYLSTNLIYYGPCEGEQMIPQKSNIWFYCKYIENGNSYFGYLYSDLCDMLTPIFPNTEEFPILEEELFPETNIENVNQTTNSSLSTPIKILIAVCVCLPCFIIIYLLFKPTKITIDNGKKRKKVSKLKKSEYYEFDD